MERYVRKIAITLAIGLASVGARAQWQIAQRGFATASAPPPVTATIRCSSAGTAAGITVSIPLASCSQAGDLNIIILGSQQFVTYPPANWALIDSSSAGPRPDWGGSPFSENLTSAEVTAGSVTFTLNASSPVAYVDIDFEGLPATSSGELGSYVADVSTTPLTEGTSVPTQSGDLVILFASARASGTTTITQGTLLQDASTTGASIAVNTMALNSGTVTVTGNYASFDTAGVYQGTLLVHGSSFNYPPETIPGLTFAFDASCVSITGTTCSSPSNGTTLTTWANRAGFNNSYATMSGTCTFRSSQIGGQPAVTFDGTSCNSNFPAPLLAQYVTGAVVMANASSAAKGTMFGSGSGGPAYWTCSGSKEQGNDAQQVSQTASGTAACDTNWHQMNFERALGNYPTYRLGESVDATINGTNAAWGSGPDAIGHNGQSGAEYLNGQAALMLWYNRALTASEVTRLETYLHSRFGI